jgi:hypothetical protein
MTDLEQMCTMLAAVIAKAKLKRLHAAKTLHAAERVLLSDQLSKTEKVALAKQFCKMLNKQNK